MCLVRDGVVREAGFNPIAGGAGVGNIEDPVNEEAICVEADVEAGIGEEAGDGEVDGVVEGVGVGGGDFEELVAKLTLKVDRDKALFGEGLFVDRGCG